MSSMTLLQTVIAICALHFVKPDKISLDSFPNPADEASFELCGRGHQSYICDPMNFLRDPKIGDEIDALLHNTTQSNLVWCTTKVQDDKLAANTDEKIRANFDGLQVGVAIISSFRYVTHQRYRHDDDVAKKSKVYAKSIHDQWGVGMQGCNNAVLIFMAINDRYMYVSTGSGIKHIISDEFVEQFVIPTRVRPLMRQSKYGQAIKVLVECIVDVLQHSDALDTHELYQAYIAYVTPETFLGLSYQAWLILGLVGGAAAFLGYKMRAEREWRECERKLAALHAQKEANKFNQTSCPICLEEFPAASAAAGSGDGDGDNGGDSGERTKQTAILVCGHRFCKDCLDSWFNSQSASNQKCPICRHDRDDWSAANGGQRRGVSTTFEQLLYPADETHTPSEVHFPDVSASAFESVLHFAYGNDPRIDAENVLALKYICERFEIGTLSAICNEFWRQTLNPENICALLNQAVLINSAEFVRECIARFSVNATGDGRNVSTVAEEKQHNPRLGGAKSKQQFVEIMNQFEWMSNPAKMHFAVPANRLCGYPDDVAKIMAEVEMNGKK